MSTIIEQRHILARNPHRSWWGEAWTHRQGIIGGFLLILFAFMAVFGPILAPHDPIAIDLGNPFADPIWLDLENGKGIMGTDNLGRDVFSRVLVGSRISLLVGTSATVVGLVIGIVMGLIAGYRGGLAGDIIMRVADTQTAIPFLVLLIAAVAFIGGGLLNIILFLGIGAWVGYARLIRGEVLSIRERDFVEAARSHRRRRCPHHVPPHPPQRRRPRHRRRHPLLRRHDPHRIRPQLPRLRRIHPHPHLGQKWSPTPATSSPPPGIPASSPPSLSCSSSSAPTSSATGSRDIFDPRLRGRQN